MMLPMMQMQAMGVTAQEKAKKLADETRQKQAYFGQYAPEAGGTPWTNPDTGKTDMGGGFINQAAPELQPMLRAMEPDKGMATMATITAQNLTKQPPASIQEFEYAKKNGYAGTFEDYKKIGGTSSLPSTVQEWNHYNGLSKEDQERFLTMKRAQPWVNLGGTQVQPSAVNPAGAPRAELTVTPKPEEDPDFKRKQAFATGMGKAEAELQGEAQKKALNALRTLDNLEGVEALIDKSTGSMGGATLDAMGAMFGHATPGSIASGKLKVLQAGLMTSMPRMEGPQSDRDVQLYREAAGQIGDSTVPNEIKKAAVETIREMQKKYQAAAMAPKINQPPAAGGWSITPVR